MRKIQNTQTEKLRECFPEISEEEAKEMDLKIKAKIHAYESSHINEEISEYIREQVIKDCIKTKNVRRVKRKCNKLASYYIQASKMWILQENWFCILTYLISIVLQICCVMEIDTALNDMVTFFANLLAIVIWLCLVKSKKFMNQSAELFLNAFNQAAPSIIIFCSLLFYIPIGITNITIYRISVIILSTLFCFCMTILWFKRMKKVI